jgi:hypothetical protein
MQVSPIFFTRAGDKGGLRARKIPKSYSCIERVGISACERAVAAVKQLSVKGGPARMEVRAAVTKYQGGYYRTRFLIICGPFSTALPNGHDVSLDIRVLNLTPTSIGRILPQVEITAETPFISAQKMRP